MTNTQQPDSKPSHPTSQARRDLLIAVLTAVTTALVDALTRPAIHALQNWLH